MSDDKLQKVMAARGLGSRREMERVIAGGEVLVNGRRANLGARVKAGDRVQWQQHQFTVPEPDRRDIRVILYNKPEGEICSRNDPEGRPSVYDRLPPVKSGRWVSVGRLDFNTSGLLLFTNDGELANKLMHPSSNIDREYMARVQGEVSDDTIQKLLDGVLLEDGLARFTDVKRANESGGSNSWFYCVVMEGRNREVRRLWESMDLRVSRLKRVRYGPIIIPSYVLPGKWLELDEKSLTELLRFAQLPVKKGPRGRKGDRINQQRQVKRLRAAAARKAASRDRRKPAPAGKPRSR